MYNVSETGCRVAVQLCTESSILNYKFNNTKERKKRTSLIIIIASSIITN
jgi:hypothetical protein